MSDLVVTLAAAQPMRRDRRQEKPVESDGVSVSIRRDGGAPGPEPHRATLRIAVIAVVLAVVALSIGGAAVYMSLGRVTKSAEQKAITTSNQNEDKSWCGIFKSLSQFTAPPNAPATQGFLNQVKAKYVSLHCPANTPTTPTHSSG